MLTPNLPDAACAGATVPDLWHSDDGIDQLDAKHICAFCPEQMACLQWALDNDEQHGIWGGMTVRERHQLTHPRIRTDAGVFA